MNDNSFKIDAYVFILLTLSSFTNFYNPLLLGPNHRWPEGIFKFTFVTLTEFKQKYRKVLLKINSLIKDTVSLLLLTAMYLQIWYLSIDELRQRNHIVSETLQLKNEGSITFYSDDRTCMTTLVVVGAYDDHSIS